VFYIAAGVYVFGTVFYAIFGSGQEQWWSMRRGSVSAVGPESATTAGGTSEA